jgi:hypothetical protein
MQLCLLLATLGLVTACAHKDLTGDDHRAAAAADVAAAERAKAKYDPDQKAVEVAPPRRSNFADDPLPPPRTYNPSAAYLAVADRKMASAFKHLEAAQRLEKFEDAACAGISMAERTACPLIAPHIESVEEGSRGVALHLRSAERGRTLAIQMRCHLAFAQANNFEKTPCPLYMKGVAIDLVGDKTIEVTSINARVARDIRDEARQMFGESSVPVSNR